MELPVLNDLKTHRFSVNNRFPAYPLIISFILFILLLFFQFTRIDFENLIFKFEPPKITSGDEPHYLLMIYSLLKDGDLELSNNYASVRRGSQDAGIRFRGSRFNHHSVWQENGIIVNWDAKYKIIDNHIIKLDPRLQGGHPEYPWNQPGLALLLAALIYPIQSIVNPEWAVHFLSALSISLFVWILYLIFLQYANPRKSVLFAQISLCCTPVLAYSRCIFPESWLCTFLAAAYYFQLRDKQWATGIFLALCIFLKVTYVLFVIPLVVYYFLNYKKLNIKIILPATVGLVGALIPNKIFFDDFLTFSNKMVYGNFFGNLFNFFFSNKGILTLSPILLFSFLGFFKRKFIPPIIYLFILGFIMSMILFALRSDWSGGYSIGPRVILPAIPILFLGIVYFPLTGWRKLAFSGLVLISLYINLRLFLEVEKYWGDKHPVTILIKE